jgi:hypothetical protein
MTNEAYAPNGQISCATYTHARRHPMVMGQIAGWTPPFQLSMPQIAVLAVSFWVEFQTWRWWGSALPRVVAVVVAIGVPSVLAWAVRRARLEGRSLLRTVFGFVALWSKPWGGRVGGRPYHAGRAVSLSAARVFVAPGETRP